MKIQGVDMSNVDATYIFSKTLYEGMEAGQKEEKIKRLFGTQPKNNPARAGWLKRLGLVRVTLWADFAVIGVQLCSTIIAIFPCVTLSYKNCSLFRIIADYCRHQKKPTI